MARATNVTRACARVPTIHALDQPVTASLHHSMLVDEMYTGGVWWDPTMTYKNAITNELFLLSSASLYQVTGNKTYLLWANKVRRRHSSRFGVLVCWFTTGVQRDSRRLFY